MKIPELLSPAGSMEAASAAVEAGANAIYVGGKDYSARHYAENVDEPELPRLMDYCHLRGVKVYVAVNTLYYNQELPKVLAFMARCREWGADAFIAQDIGLAVESRRLFPDMPLHASTQMTARTVSDAKALKALGFSRVILSRELDFDTIAQIRAEADIETETFAHGALCVSYSGQCLMSGFIGKRSGNRGKCAQPCRKKYALEAGSRRFAEGYLLSMKDLNTLPILSDYAAAGVTAVKIEGRMKSAAYVYYVTRAYRAALDSPGMAVDAETARKAGAVFARGGFTEGYGRAHSAPEMICADAPGPQGAYAGKVVGYDAKRGLCRILFEAHMAAGDGIAVHTRTEPYAGAYVNAAARPGEMAAVSVGGDIRVGDKVYKTYDKRLMDDAARLMAMDTRKITVDARIRAKIGEPLALALTHGELRVSGEGAAYEQAANAPLTKERLLAQLSKTGGTPFAWRFVDTEIDEGGFAPMSAINELRRGVSEQLAERLSRAHRRAPAPHMWTAGAPNPATSHSLSALVQNKAQMEAALNSDTVKRVYIEAAPSLIQNIGLYKEMCAARGAALYVALPPEADDGFQDYLRLGADGFLARSAGAIRAARELGRTVAADYTLNVLNRAAFNVFSGAAQTVCLSAEANAAALRELAAENLEAIAYGKLPLMTTRQCPVGLFAAGKTADKHCALRGKAEGYALRDKTGARFPILTRCGACEAVILNASPLCMLTRPEHLRGAGWLRLQFTDEPPARVLEVCAAFGELPGGSEATARVTAAMAEEGFTYGWFFSEL